MSDQTIGKKIKQLRQEKRLSITELSEKAGVSKSYLSTIERNLQKNPSVQFLEKIAEVLGVSVLSLIHSQEDPHEWLDPDWIELIEEAMDSGIDKQEFKEFLEFQRWKKSQN
ncbi:XRE family transcriptional regulator of biofilm formation [Pullulanibacillus pueri]|uniref:Transcriptional regulator n=1 Tax=Pullulanibacillus pueri TaxID=1437324 RepID=A0A8J3ELY3_9BACL|nr:helix-turn-helix domain-containing protein [Pullulanibacillus pueri]MBM7682278.1 XRE family transcriptional regulator of biofilm formation [Pullulanibacillus pueri]GGH80974.1 transcriptional regulator [Pullulanibacillus pueri]